MAVAVAGDGTGIADGADGKDGTNGTNGVDGKDGTNSKRQCDLFGHTASYINTSLWGLR